MVVSILLRDRAWPRRLRRIPAGLLEAHLAAGFPTMALRRRDVRSICRAFDNPDHVAVVIHNYRWRLGLAEGESKFDALEAELARGPAIAVPTITLEGDANGAPHPEPSAYARKFTGRYQHRNVSGGIGHNLPQEAPRAFAEAIIDADRM